jgi:UrcA family protein
MLYSKKSFVTSVSCVLFGFALYAPAAFAGLEDDPPSIKVSYAELDLSKPAGAQTLYRRIKKAAQAVCAESFQGSGPVRPFGQKQCEERAIERAVNEVNRPLLSSLWQKQPRFAYNH